MAKKLKTFVTSLGFFDHAVAAPSMKAALDAWGSKSNLFHQGFAREVDDPAIVEATMAKPGVVLKRPIGSHGPFTESAELPAELPAGEGRRKPAKQAKEPAKSRKQKSPRKEIDPAAARKAAAAFEREERKREKERRKEEAARQKEGERRQKAVAKAEAALEAAERDHRARMRAIEDKRAALDSQSEAEDARWRKVREPLETALRRARS